MPSIAVNGTTLSYRDEGAPADLAILLVHAFPLAGEQWRDQVPRLASELGARVVAPDLRGFGASAVPPGPYPMDLFAGDLLAMADALGLDRFVLCGLSMGGYVALALMRLAPDRVRALVLADTRPGADDETGRANRESLAQLAEREGSAAVATLQAPRLLSPSGLANPDLVARVSAMITANQPAGIAAASRGMALRPDSTDLLPGIACPTQIIVGELDAVTPLSDARLMFERIPDARLAVLRDAGHLSNLEASEEFTSELITFVRAQA